MTNTKPWWQSKTIWAGVATVIFSAWTAAHGAFGIPDVPTWLLGILAALTGTGTIIGRTAATKAIGDSK